MFLLLGFKGYNIVFRSCYISLLCVLIWRLANKKVVKRLVGMDPSNKSDLPRWKVKILWKLSTNISNQPNSNFPTFTLLPSISSGNHSGKALKTSRSCRLEGASTIHGVAPPVPALETPEADQDDVVEDCTAGESCWGVLERTRERWWTPYLQVNSSLLCLFVWWSSSFQAFWWQEVTLAL